MVLCGMACSAWLQFIMTCIMVLVLPLSQQGVTCTHVLWCHTNICSVQYMYIINYSVPRRTTYLTHRNLTHPVIVPAEPLTRAYSRSSCGNICYFSVYTVVDVYVVLQNMNTYIVWSLPRRWLTSPCCITRDAEVVWIICRPRIDPQ